MGKTGNSRVKNLLASAHNVQGKGNLARRIKGRPHNPNSSPIRQMFSFLELIPKVKGMSRTIATLMKAGQPQRQVRALEDLRKKDELAYAATEEKNIKDL